jgi:hypothetical protein
VTAAARKRAAAPRAANDAAPATPAARPANDDGRGCASVPPAALATPKVRRECPPHLVPFAHALTDLLLVDLLKYPPGA